jgi:hypothetical protein
MRRSHRIARFQHLAGLLLLAGAMTAASHAGGPMDSAGRIPSDNDVPENAAAAPAGAYAEGDSLERILFPNSRVRARIPVPYPEFRVTQGPGVVVLAGEFDGLGTGDVALYDTDGRELWKRGGYRRIPMAMASENSDKLVLFHADTLHRGENNDGHLCACIRLDGSVLWEKWMPPPHIAMSPDGVHGYIPTVSAIDGDGQFRWFDLSTGSEIEVPFLGDYRQFTARFTGNGRILMVLQQKISRRDTAMALETADRFRTLQREGKTKEAFALAKKTQVGWLAPVYHRRYVALDVSSRSVAVTRVLDGGRPARFYFRNEDELSCVSPDGAFFAIVAFDSGLDAGKSSSHPTVIQMFDDRGSPLWEKTDFHSVNDAAFLGSRLVVLDGDTLCAFEAADGNETGKWKIDGLRRGRDRFRTLVPDDDGLAIQFGDGSDARPRPLVRIRWNTEKAASLQNSGRPMALISRRGNQGVLFDFDRRSILLMQEATTR